MAVRNDVTVDWFASPRIITVAAPSTEITIQDLLDTCRELEDDLINTVFDPLASAAGKENLGGGVKVGITLTLLNAVLAFEARPGPTYTQCRVTGGNLVAVDDNGADISPIYPTAFTQVLTTASSSATLQEQLDIQHSSFNGRVTVDISSGYSGTEYPVGTPRQPVNNMADAITIANQRGLLVFHIIENITIGNGIDISGKTIMGECTHRTTVTVASGAITNDAEFTNLTLEGSLDGHTRIKNSIIGSISNVNGVIENCLLKGTIILNGPIDIWNCADAIAGIGIPILDFNGDGYSVNIRNYSGGFQLQNKYDANSVSIDCVSARIILTNTITNGDFIIRGVGVLIDNSTGTANIDFTNLVNPQSVTNAVWDEPLAGHLLTGSMGEALANAGLTPEQAKQLLLIFVNSL